jgi:hypothetical protein
VPINIDNAHPAGSSGLTAGHLALTYDPRVFTVSAADVHLGSLLAAGSGWSVVPTINPVTGEIAIALTSATPITSMQGGSLVTIDFHPIDYGEPSGVSRRIPTPMTLVASVNPTGQQVILTELEDAQGTFTLTPAPTSGFGPQVWSVGLPTAALEATPNAPVGEPLLVNTLAPLATDTLPGDASILEPATSPRSAMVSDPTEPFVTAGQMTLADSVTVHVSAASAHIATTIVTLASGTVAPLNSAPFPSLVFQLSALPLASMSSAEGVDSQRLPGEWLQALARGTVSATDPMLVVGNLRDIFEHVLANQLRLSPSPMENTDGLVWDEGGRDLNWQATRDLMPLPGHCNRPEVRTDAPTRQESDSRGAWERAALDLYFGDTATDGE